MNQFVQFFLVVQLERGVEFSSHHARDSAINASPDCNTCSPTFLSGGTNGTSCSQMQRRGVVGQLDHARHSLWPVLGCPSAAGAGRLATTRGEQSTGVRESQPQLRGCDGRAALRARSGKTRLCKQETGLSGSLATAGDTSQPDAGFLLSARSFASGYVAWGLRG